jgi:phosphoesterase RecJ-like protein
MRRGSIHPHVREPQYSALSTQYSALPVLGPRGDRRLARRIARLVAAAGKIVISGHERPDGDCIGSEVALCAILRRAGFDAEIVNSDPTPARYAFLLDRIVGEQAVPLRVLGKNETTLEAGLFFALDATNLPRLGRVAPLLRNAAARTIVMDHHEGDSAFGAVNWVESAAAASAELIWRLASCCGWEAPRTALNALYTGLVTDTGQFSYRNTSARVLRMAAELVERGVDTERIWRKVYLNKSLNELALEARARASLRSAAGGRIASIALSHGDFQATGTGPQDTEEMANIPRSLAGVELSLFFYEVDHGKQTKVSMRSASPVNVEALARRFGGGGHKQAAACLLGMGLAAAKRVVLAEAERYIRSGDRAIG